MFKTGVCQEAVCQFSIFLSKPDGEVEKQQTAERVGYVITADAISGGWLPWYPAATGCSLINWLALVSQQHSVSFFHLSFSESASASESIYCDFQIHVNIHGGEMLCPRSDIGT